MVKLNELQKLMSEKILKWGSRKNTTPSIARMTSEKVLKGLGVWV